MSQTVFIYLCKKTFFTYTPEMIKSWGRLLSKWLTFSHFSFWNVRKWGISYARDTGSESQIIGL